MEIDSTFVQDSHTDAEELPTAFPVVKSATKRICQPKQGILNKLIQNVKFFGQLQGHDFARFDRDYSQGTATGICKNCNSYFTVDANSKSISGSDPNQLCVHEKQLGDS